MSIRRTTEENRKLCERFPWLKHDANYEYVWILDDIPPGWEDLAMDMILEIDDELGRCDCKEKFVIVEVKEKWGMMRVYWGCKNPFDDPIPEACMIDDIIAKYEKMSKNICPNCGRYKNPIKWLCKNCWKFEDT